MDLVAGVEASASAGVTEQAQNQPARCAARGIQGYVSVPTGYTPLSVLPILVDLAPPDVTPQQSSALLAACNEVSADRRCLSAPDPTRATARVRWLEGGNVAEVQAWVDGKWRSRRLLFAENDLVPERWRAAGLVVGSMFEPEAPAAPPEPAPPREEQTRPITRPEETDSKRYRLSLGGLGGNGLEDGTLRWGGFVRMAYQPTEFPLGVSATLSAAYRPVHEDISAQWLSATMGPVALWNATPNLGLEVGIELGQERFLVTLKPTDTDPEQSETRAYLTLSGHLMGRLLLGEHVGAIAGVGLATTPGQPVRIDGQQVAGNPRLSLTLRLGLHATF